MEEHRIAFNSIVELVVNKVHSSYPAYLEFDRASVLHGRAGNFNQSQNRDRLADCLHAKKRIGHAFPVPMRLAGLDTRDKTCLVLVSPREGAPRKIENFASQNEIKGTYGRAHKS